MLWNSLPEELKDTIGTSTFINEMVLVLLYVFCLFVCSVNDFSTTRYYGSQWGIFAFWRFLSDISATRGRIHTKFYLFRDNVC